MAWRRKLEGLIRVIGQAVLLACVATTAAAQIPNPPGSSIEMASLQAPPEATLEDLLANRVGRVFVPTLQPGISLKGDSDQANWVRLRATAAQEGAWYLRTQAPAGTRIQLFIGGPQPRALQAAHVTDRIYGSALRFDLEAAGPYTVFARIEHQGTYLFVPELLDEDSHRQRAGSDKAGYLGWAMALLLIIVAGAYRRWQRQESNGLTVLIVASLFLVALLVDMHPSLGGLGGWLASLRLLPWALALVALSRLLPLTAEFVAVGKYAAALSPLVTRFSLLLLVLAIGLLFTPADWVGLAEKGVAVVLTMACFFAALLSLFDVRATRWLPILAWSLTLMMVLGYLLAVSQGYAFGPALRRWLPWPLIAMLAGILIFPWLRQINQQRDMAKRAVVPELSTEEKIEIARERLMQSLNAGLANADEDDVEWIAFRRLLAGLKPVLSQLSSAVVAKDYYGEDLLIPDVPETESRYRVLLEHRGNVLKNLARMRAPQQVRIDFDDQGPMPMVMLAVIPLPVDRPGWGALLIERADGVTYSEQELDLCAEFASLAWTAGDEAYDALAERIAGLTDAASGLGNRQSVDAAMQSWFAKTGSQHGVVSVLMIRFDANAEDLPLIGETIRSESEFGVTLGRYDERHFLMFCPGKHGGPARELGDDIIKAVRGAFEARDRSAPMLSIGVSSRAPMERNASAMLERASIATDKAEEDGGNQTQVINAHA